MGHKRCGEQMPCVYQTHLASSPQEGNHFPGALQSEGLENDSSNTRQLGMCSFLGLALNFLHPLSCIISWHLWGTQLRMLRPCEMVEFLHERSLDH